MKQKITLAIGIPAYNEEKNIAILIKQIYRQWNALYSLKEILIISDGSSDSTLEELEKLKSKIPVLKVVDERIRLGKPQRINEIFSMLDTDVVVILDADIKMNSLFVINNLIKPIIYNNIHLTSGKALPINPKTFISRVIYKGIMIWEDIKKTAKGEMYTCEGQIRAFSKELYKSIYFPPYSADDVYPYLFAMQQGFRYEWVQNAKIYYKLPSSILDYVNQHLRYLQSENIQTLNFSKEITNTYYSISPYDKLRVAVSHVGKNPLLTLSYLVLLLLPKVLHIFSNTGKDSTWSVIKSSKSVYEKAI